MEFHIFMKQIRFLVQKFILQRKGKDFIIWILSRVLFFLLELE